MLTPLKQLPVRTAQFLNAVQANLSGGWNGFATYAQGTGTLGVDPSSPLWIAVYIEGFTLPSGTLASAVSAYLTASTASGGLGMTSTNAAAQMASLFTAAAQVGN